ncbi:hypothetical protein HERIO_616 [Hepatospora eriocheir]|uniref:Uncharacterized protein n=1 Tax=Hepatospora eriocheir TaxID=1081669 RepID=A0A1X0QCY5_9MICR|nr:hypothetical protein HERIO_616 [Hepatospora eriocheir]
MRHSLLREQTVNLLFGLSIMFLIVSSVRTLLFFNSSETSVIGYYTGILLTIVLIGLTVDFVLGVLGLFICMSLNNFLTRSLPNLIGAYQRIRGSAYVLFFNIIICRCADVYTFLFRYSKDNIFKNKLFYYLLLIFMAELSVLFSSWLLHPDLFGLRFKKYVNQFIKNKRRTTNIV